MVEEIKMEKTIYQIRYSKGSYESFATWCGDELYETRELAQEAMEKFKEENSLDNFWKKMKLSKREDWGPDYEMPAIYVTTENQTVVPKGLNMSIDEFLDAINDDISLFYDYLCPDEGYNYDQFDIVERKLLQRNNTNEKDKWHKVSNGELPEITSEETCESLMYIGDNNHDTLTCKTNVMLSDELLLSREDGPVKIGRFRKIETFSSKDNTLINSWVGFLYENGYECKLNDNEVKAWMELPKYVQ